MRKSLLLLVLLVLTGCTALPTSGPVQSIDVQAASDDTGVQYLPVGPAKGASQADILDGFLAAGTDAQDNYRVARLFLTDDASANWNPLQETIVRGTDVTQNPVGSTTTIVTVPVTARVTRGGFYTAEKSAATQSLTFEFARVDGEWRITSAPNAVLVSKATFDSVYLPFTVYFYNAERTQLVPEIRYFPRQGDPTTEVARAVIAGPSSYLPDAVTAFPPTASLVASPVELVDGRALVDVSSEIVAAPVKEQRAMLVEMAASLREISGISNVSLTVDRNVVNVSESGSTSALMPSPVNTKPLIVRAGVLGYADAISVDSIGKVGDRVAALKPTSVSYDIDGFAAVGTSTGVFLVGQSTATVSTVPSRVDPAIDGRSAVWWVNPASPSEIEVFHATRQSSFTGPWSARSKIIALKVSREDARVAIAVDTPSGPELYIASIARDSNGAVRGVSGFHQLAIQGSQIVDIAWASPTAIGVLSKTVAVSYVELASVGGTTRQMGQPESPVSIVGGNDVTELVVRGSDGQLWQPRGSGWQSFGVVAELLATQH